MDRNPKTHPGPFASWGVALRKESVDRNRDRGPDTGIAAVALRKESVDRNALRACAIACMVCRSPQGERG